MLDTGAREKLETLADRHGETASGAASGLCLANALAKPLRDIRSRKVVRKAEADYARRRVASAMKEHGEKQTVCLAVAVAAPTEADASVLTMAEDELGKGTRGRARKGTGKGKATEKEGAAWLAQRAAPPPGALESVQWCDATIRRVARSHARAHWTRRRRDPASWFAGRCAWSTPGRPRRPHLGPAQPRGGRCPVARDQARMDRWRWRTAAARSTRRCDPSISSPAPRSNPGSASSTLDRRAGASANRAPTKSSPNTTRCHGQPPLVSAPLRVDVKAPQARSGRRAGPPAVGARRGACLRAGRTRNGRSAQGDAKRSPAAGPARPRAGRRGSSSPPRTATGKGLDDAIDAAIAAEGPLEAARTITALVSPAAPNSGLVREAARARLERARRRTRSTAVAVVAATPQEPAPKRGNK